MAALPANDGLPALLAPLPKPLPPELSKLPPGTPASGALSSADEQAAPTAAPKSTHIPFARMESSSARRAPRLTIPARGSKLDSRAEAFVRLQERAPGADRHIA